MHHLLQPRRRRGALHLLQRRRLAGRRGGRRRDGHAAGGQLRLLDDDLGDGGGVRRGGRRWRLGFDGAGAGACGDLRQVQDDVGGTDVGDGVLLGVVVLRPGGASGEAGGRHGCDGGSRGWRWGRRGGVHDFNRGLKRRYLDTKKRTCWNTVFCCYVEEL